MAKKPTKPTGKGKKPTQSPAKQAIPGAGKGGNVPPVASRWPPGVSGNPAGRPPAMGSTIREWWNTMQTWTRAEVAGVMRDPTAPMAQVYAARNMIHATSLDLNNAGQPIATADMLAAIEHTAGKAVQAMTLRSTSTSTNLEAKADLTGVDDATLIRLVDALAGGEPDADG